MRWDYEIVPGFEDFVTPANVVAALNGPFPGVPPPATYASILALGGPGYPGIDINQYISTGSNRKAKSNEFQPRLGFSYDINQDRHYVIFGGYGRSYDRNLYSTLSLETTKIALNSNPQVYFPSPETSDAFGACATAADINPVNHCYAWNPAYLTAAGLAGFQTASSSHEVDMINNNIKTPYSDQFSVGFRTRMGDWNTAATLSDVKSYDTIMGHLGNRYSNGQYFQNGAPWGAQGVPGVGTLILWDNGGNDEDLQLGLSAVKPYTRESGWSMTIAYTYSDAYQNNLSGDTSSYQANYNQYLFDYPFANLLPYLPSAAVPKHRLVVTASRDLPWNLVVAGKLTLETPIPINGAAGCPVVCTPYGGTTLEESGIPRDKIGYKDVDLQLTKNISLPRDITGYFRLDMLNAFNFWNFDSQAANWDESATAPTYNRSGPIIGVPLTLKISAGFKW